MAAYRRDIEAADDPVAFREDRERRLIAIRSPFRAAESFNAEELIDPRETRSLLCDWVALARAKLATHVGPRMRGMRP